MAPKQPLLPEKTPTMMQELIAAWDKLRQHYDRCLKAEQTTDQEEDELLKLRTWIIRRSRTMQLLLPDRYNAHKEIFNVLVQFSSMERMLQESPIIQNNLRTIWHEAFITLSKISGIVRERVAAQQQEGGRKR